MSLPCAASASAIAGRIAEVLLATSFDQRSSERPVISCLPPRRSRSAGRVAVEIDHVAGLPRPRAVFIATPTSACAAPGRRSCHPVIATSRPFLLAADSACFASASPRRVRRRPRPRGASSSRSAGCRRSTVTVQYPSREPVERSRIPSLTTSFRSTTHHLVVAATTSGVPPRAPPAPTRREVRRRTLPPARDPVDRPFGRPLPAIHPADVTPLMHLCALSEGTNRPARSSSSRARPNAPWPARRSNDPSDLVGEGRRACAASARSRA